jgi:hypothetical protein
MAVSIFKSKGYGHALHCVLDRSPPSPGREFLFPPHALGIFAKLSFNPREHRLVNKGCCKASRLAPDGMDSLNALVNKSLKLELDPEALIAGSS